jgi:hypothetical protein
MASDYRGWDVHQYSPYLRDRLAELGRDFSKSPDDGEFQAVCSEISQLLDTTTEPPPDDAQLSAARLALAKMRNRAAAGNYVDPDLGGAQVGAILVETWRKVQQADDVKAVFIETLADIGDTCVQGDSHRLLLLWLALQPEGGIVLPDGMKTENGSL